MAVCSGFLQGILKRNKELKGFLLEKRRDIPVFGFGFISIQGMIVRTGRISLILNNLF
jgi:hypothetical protein